MSRRTYTYDIKTGRLVDFTTGSVISVAALFANDKLPIEVNFASPTGQAFTAPYAYEDFSTSTIRFGIVLPGTKPTAGTFTLTTTIGLGGTTAAIAYNASAATVKAALEAVAAIGAGNVDVELVDDSFWKITYKGALANTNVDLITGSATSLSPKSQVITGTEQVGGGGLNEIQMVELARVALAENTTWTPAGAPSYGFVGQLNLGTTLVEAISMAAASGVEVKLECERTDSDGGKQTFQDSIRLIGDGLKDGAETPNPVETALTQTSGDARYLRKVSPYDATTYFEYQADGTVKLFVKGVMAQHWQ